MLYDYVCPCGERFEVIKSMSESSRLEHCPKCREVGRRVFSPPQICGAKVFESTYYHSLGKVINNKRELQYEMDKRNIVQVGNDFSSSEKMQNSFDSERSAKREKNWESLKDE